jgi:hypothetical protein
MIARGGAKRSPWLVANESTSLSGRDNRYYCALTGLVGIGGIDPGLRFAPPLAIILCPFRASEGRLLSFR